MNRKLVALMLSLGACTPAQTASYSLSNDSDNFRVMRPGERGQTMIGSR